MGGSAPVGGVPASKARGVTAKQIRIGIFTEDPSSTQTAASLGLKGLDVGNLPGNWNALIANQNKHGGLFGRQLVPVIYEESITSSNPDQDAASACAKMTQDQPVYAVFTDIIFNDVFASCIKKAGIPLFYGQAAADIATLKSLGNIIITASMSLDRVASNYVDSLAATGFLQPKNKIGLIQTDLPRYDSVVASSFKPAVARHGLNLAQIAKISPVSSGDYGGIGSQMSAAVLRFKAAGVDRVLFLATNATEPLLWQDAAASQNYTPAEGLTSINAPELLQSSGSKRELANAQGMGWIPTEDVTAGHDGGATAAQKHCLSVLAAYGETDNARTAQVLAELECDTFFLFVRASSLLSVPADALSYVGTVQRKIGAGYTSTASFAEDFTGRYDGAAAYRPFAYKQDCTCFTYSGPTAHLP